MLRLDGQTFTTPIVFGERGAAALRSSRAGDCFASGGPCRATPRPNRGLVDGPSLIRQSALSQGVVVLGAERVGLSRRREYSLRVAGPVPGTARFDRCPPGPHRTGNNLQFQLADFPVWQDHHTSETGPSRQPRRKLQLEGLHRGHVQERREWPQPGSQFGHGFVKLGRSPAQDLFSLHTAPLDGGLVRLFLPRPTRPPPHYRSDRRNLLPPAMAGVAPAQRIDTISKPPVP